MHRTRPRRGCSPTGIEVDALDASEVGLAYLAGVARDRGLAIHCERVDLRDRPSPPRPP